MTAGCGREISWGAEIRFSANGSFAHIIETSANPSGTLDDVVEWLKRADQSFHRVVECSSRAAKPDRLEISGFMREVAGEFSRFYNQRKARSNAFWGDNFHATLVEEGDYLWHCLRYIELNMVRCGVVSHPSQWDWVGYHEIMGARQRYRLINLERLCWRLRFNSVEELRRNLAAALQEAIAKEEMKREAHWTESLAVGSRGYVEKVQPLILSRRETDVVETPSCGWVLKESEAPYGAKSALENCL